MAFVNKIGNIINYTYPIQNTTKFNLLYKEKFLENLDEILNSGNLILGKKAEEFETKMADYIGVKYCLGTSSGTTALELAILSLDLKEEDEIIIQGNTFIASAFSTRFTKSKIIPVDVNINGQLDMKILKKSITKNTKCIIVVHLYGDCCNMIELQQICQEKNIYLIEDCAQAQGTKYANNMIGSYGDISCFSFYPSKNLGALGDGGAICTNNDYFYEKMKRLRNLGAVIKYKHEIKGGNYRIDALQCSFLLTKFADLNSTIEKKREIAKYYEQYLDNTKYIHLKNKDNNIYHSYHLFVILLKNIDRTKLSNYLSENGIETIIHYPTPFHKSEAYNELNNLKLENTEFLSENIISLPIDSLMNETDVIKICNIMNYFYLQ